MKSSIVSLVVLAPSAMGFMAPCQIEVSSSLLLVRPLEMASTGLDEDSLSPNDLPTQQGKRMSESLPFLSCPRVLQESDLAGNVGFDPLGLAQNKEQLWEYREAEIKHARLAMLAAIGWPVSELMDRNIADFFKAPTMLDEGDRVPTVLNGGIGKIPVEFWGFCLGLSAAIDMYGVAKARRGDQEYFPGNLGFDPLNLYPIDKKGQELMKLAEIKHGRTAMVGVLGYVIEEYKTHIAVVDETPFLFQPITETVEGAIEGALNVEEAIVGVVGAIGTEEAIHAVGTLGAL